jgi:hypothetical protein
MLPRPYELPGALLLVLGGALACFAGHRLFRIVLGVYGFVFGAMLASSVMGITNAVGMVAAAALGGVVGAIVLVFAWFVGVAIVGAGLGALIAHLAWNQMKTSDPQAWVVIVVAVIGAAVAMTFQRMVIVIGTAFAGAWTVLVGVVNVMAIRAGAAPGSEAVWILYPLTAANGRLWVPVAWVALGLAGAVVQLGGKKGKRKRS